MIRYLIVVGGVKLWPEAYPTARMSVVWAAYLKSPALGLSSHSLDCGSRVVWPQGLFMIGESTWRSDAETESDVTYSHVWWHILGNSYSVFNPSKVHTHSSEHTHREHAPRAVGSHLCCAMLLGLKMSVRCFIYVSFYNKITDMLNILKCNPGIKFLLMISLWES